MRIRDWSSDVCSSDLLLRQERRRRGRRQADRAPVQEPGLRHGAVPRPARARDLGHADHRYLFAGAGTGRVLLRASVRADGRSEEHTSELQSLMRISYAVLCLNKKKITPSRQCTTTTT